MCTRRLRYTSRPSAPLTLAIILTSGSAFAGSGPVSKDLGSTTNAQQQAVEQYWTQERMRSAKPKQLLSPPPATSGGPATTPGPQVTPTELPGWSPGWSPGSKAPQPDSNLRMEIAPGSDLFNLLMGGVQPQTTPPFGPPANPTDFINYAPFQRFHWVDNYRTYPAGTVGKLFFTQNGTDFVCSASVIQKNTLATAGHCVSDGNGHFSTNVLFCPSFLNGADPTRGCWSGRALTTSSQWHNSSESDRDYGCIVTAPTGTVVANSVGNVTGWLGRAWNWSSRQAEFAWGYPQAAPFNGNRLITTTSTEWYQLDMGGDTVAQSKYIGNDMTGGASGGPWWLNMANRSVEFADTDGSSLTDPFQATGNRFPLINGVNSHKRCARSGCPAGSIFTQEMGSPTFRLSSTDNNDSEDVFAVCFSNGGT